MQAKTVCAALLFAMWASSPTVAFAQDADGDGYTTAEGDCDDEAAAAHPGLPEDCSDDLDNDCDGLFNGGCNLGSRQGSLRGGGGCTAADEQPPKPSGTALVLLPLAFARRLRRKQA